MLAIKDLESILKVDKSKIYNKLRKKQYAAYLSKVGKEKYLKKEALDMLKEEFESDNIENTEEIAVTIVDDPEEFFFKNIEKDNQIEKLEKKIEELELQLRIQAENYQKLLIQQNTIIIQNNQLQLKNNDRCDSLLLEKKEELLYRQKQYEELKEKKKFKFKFWTKN